MTKLELKNLIKEVLKENLKPELNVGVDVNATTRKLHSMDPSTLDKVLDILKDFSKMDPNLQKQMLRSFAKTVKKITTSIPELIKNGLSVGIYNENGNLMAYAVYKGTVLGTQNIQQMIEKYPELKDLNRGLYSDYIRGGIAVSKANTKGLFGVSGKHVHKTYDEALKYLVARAKEVFGSDITINNNSTASKFGV